MLFGSFQFLFGFLPVTLILYHFCRHYEWQLTAKVVLVLASLFFYGWWDYRYIPLVLGSIAVNYLAGALLRSGPGAPRRTAVFVLGIVFNLGLLGYYKYANFFVSNVTDLVGVNYAIAHIALPLGISFFTFQQIAYLAETYKGQPRASSLLDYTLFILFFPHLIAGPITHHTEMLPQFARAGRGTFDGRYVTMGAAVLILGLAKKVLVADTLATLANPVFAAAVAGHPLDRADSWLGALAYTFQLYFDFSGYSDMAIGIGLLFGIRFPINFASPYKSLSIAEFWHRWHMTLSRFLRNYLYIAMGGNRRGKLRRYINLMVTMTLGGLWHGAGWTFLVWGFLHGLYLILNHAWNAVAGERHLPRPAAWAVTFLCVVVAWVFFRAPTLASALHMLHAMAAGGVSEGVDLPVHVLGWVLIGAASVMAFLMPNTLELAAYPEGLDVPVAGARELHRLHWRRAPATVTAVALGVVGAFCFAQLPHPGVFLYFTF
jgi:D-alanyl-lipoteichoic acid acyltransferase DltB (MBOAT superfamily)